MENKDFKFDESMLREEDLELFREVTQYLDSCGVDYEVGGSARENALNGNPRNYGDIDLVVKSGSNPQGRQDAIMGIVWGLNGVTDHDLTVPSFTALVIYHSSEGQNYVNWHIDERFKIHDPETDTTIDLCFEVKGDAFEYKKCSDLELGILSDYISEN